MSLNTIKVPSLEQMGEVASELGLSLAEAELAAHHQSLLGAFGIQPARPDAGRDADFDQIGPGHCEEPEATTQSRAEETRSARDCIAALAMAI
jgi:hypothetical protein